MSRVEVVIQSPIQNREDTLSKPERLIPLLIAESINRQVEHSSGEIVQRVDVWNNVSRKIDQQFSNQNRFETRRAYSLDLIEQRYAILKSIFGIDDVGRIIISDDLPEYEAVVREQIDHNLSIGRFKVQQQKFHFCSDCQKIIAPMEAAVTKCLCGNEHLDIRTYDAMFMEMSNQDKATILDRLRTSGNNRTRRDFEQRLSSMPRRILISKQRDYGFSLDYLGLKMVLDPRITLSYFPTIVEDYAGVKVATIVQGVDTSANTIPFTLLLVEQTNPKYLLINKAYGFSCETSAGLRSFYGQFLPLMLAGSSTNIDIQRTEALKKEYDRTITKFINVQKALDQGNAYQSICTFSAEEQQILNNSRRLISEMEFRKTALVLRSFLFEVLSKKYVELCKKDGVRINPVMLQSFIDQFKLIYG